MKDTVEQAIWETFGDAAPIILGHYYDSMRAQWQEQHKKKYTAAITDLSSNLVVFNQGDTCSINGKVWDSANIIDPDGTPHLCRMRKNKAWIDGFTYGYRWEPWDMNDDRARKALTIDDEIAKRKEYNEFMRYLAANCL